VDGDGLEGFEPIHLGEGFSTILGTVYADRSRGRLKFLVTDVHRNPANACHGGAIALFADVQIAALVLDLDTAEVPRPTITISLDFLAPVPVGSWVEAEVSLVKETRTLVFTEALLRVDGEPVARSNAIYRNKKIRSLTHG